MKLEWTESGDIYYATFGHIRFKILHFHADRTTSYRQVYYSLDFCEGYTFDTLFTSLYTAKEHAEKVLLPKLVKEAVKERMMGNG